MYLYVFVCGCLNNIVMVPPFPRWCDHLLPQFHPGHHGGVAPRAGLRAEEGAPQRPAGAGNRARGGVGKPLKVEKTWIETVV